MLRNDINNTRIAELNEELYEDLKLSEVTITEKALMCPGLKTKWIQIYYEEKKRLKLLNKLKDKLKEDYINKYGQEGVPRIKTQNESEKCDEIKSVNNKIELQVEVIEYLREILDMVIKNLGYDIGTAKELIKIEQ